MDFRSYRGVRGRIHSIVNICRARTGNSVSSLQEIFCKRVHTKVDMVSLDRPGKNRKVLLPM